MSVSSVLKSSTMQYSQSYVCLRACVRLFHFFPSFPCNLNKFNITHNTNKKSINLLNLLQITRSIQILVVVKEGTKAVMLKFINIRLFVLYSLEKSRVYFTAIPSCTLITVCWYKITYEESIHRKQHCSIVNCFYCWERSVFSWCSFWIHGMGEAAVYM